ncbi:MAG: type II and III secretion system protein [Bacteroidota bacterium]
MLRFLVPRYLPACVLLFAAGLLAQDALAQIDPTPPQRQIRTYIPPDQLVSFSAETPFNQFVEFVNPLFQRVTGKAVVDLTERTAPIGVNVSGLQFLDAFELVLAQSGLVYRETDRYFLVEPFSAAGDPSVVGPATPAPVVVSRTPEVTGDDREIRIDAIIFEANVDRLRELGTNWTRLLGSQQQGGGGGSTGNDSNRLRLFLNTEPLFDQLSDVLTGPDQIDLAEINAFFRLLESRGVGETISSPSIVVRSGEEGRIQSGSDIPVTLRDFAGNTVVQYIATGVIVTVRPVLILDDEDPGRDPVEFIHLVVDVEKSSGRLGGNGLIIDKNEAATDVLLLDGEQTVIGGLYSTEESVSRSGIPILMDIPLLGYLFSTKNRSLIERELIIVLQTRLVDPLRERAQRAFRTDIRDEEREDVRRRLLRANPTTEPYLDELPENDDQ